MLGAIIGDIVGSTRERHNIKTENFELVPDGSRFTDDTVMTLAVAEWLMTDPNHQAHTLVACMQRLGRKYPNAGYGGLFSKWLHDPHPQPYGSYGNGSAMRVSPVGLYANSLEEALDLARVSASVSHNHPEGIKGAQAIAASVYLRYHEHASPDHIKEYVTQRFGYDLDFDLEELRKTYRFDSSCAGSVPVAIKAFLDRNMYPAEDALRLAISMGGDSDTIGAMTASIAGAVTEPKDGFGLDEHLILQCRSLLPPDLLDINNRFMAFITRPLPQSFRVSEELFAGEYPGGSTEESTLERIRHLHHFGVRHFVDLTEEGEMSPYCHQLPADTQYHRFPIPIQDAPSSVKDLQDWMEKLLDWTLQDGFTYLHSHGNDGRLWLIVSCFLIRRSSLPFTGKSLRSLQTHLDEITRSVVRLQSETQDQQTFVSQYLHSCELQMKQVGEQTRDRIRGSLMAGAAGDALGYAVEFLNRADILSRYGGKGITRFDVDPDGLALVSDDTQMTLFTANGLLSGISWGRFHGATPDLVHYIKRAYVDWYYTQVKSQDDPARFGRPVTWLRHLPSLAQQRAPGTTCLTACEQLLQNKEVHNQSKGCGGIMRVAPVALLMAGYWSRNQIHCSTKRMDELGAQVAAITHQHPLGFLPAAMLTHLLYRLIRTDVIEIREHIREMALETIEAVKSLYPGIYESSKAELESLTRQALDLAANDQADAVNIRSLGEGWTAEETWAIALYCSVRHVDSLEEALIAAVNHDGDSDSTGAVCGNIMGAIYGYESIRQQRLFCPPGKEFDSILELANIILSLSDDLYKGCQLVYHDPLETYEAEQWYERYCEMRPVGLSNGVEYNRAFTPDCITELREDEIFVFGSNLQGYHRGGAARIAHQKFGAVWGCGVGFQGQAYAIPTMQGGVDTIRPYVYDFIDFAKEHSELKFLVTRIGCGIAGFRDAEIAPLFEEALMVRNILLPKEFVECLLKM